MIQAEVKTFERRVRFGENHARVDYIPQGYEQVEAFSLMLNFSSNDTQLTCDHNISYGAAQDPIGEPFAMAESYAEAILDLINTNNQVKEMVADGEDFNSIVLELMKFGMGQETLEDGPRTRILHIVRLGNDRAVVKGEVYKDVKAVVKDLMFEWGEGNLCVRNPTSKESAYWSFMLDRKMIKAQKYQPLR
jgi:hypothetical protein